MMIRTCERKLTSRNPKCTTDRPCRPCQVNGLDCLDDSGPEGVDLRTVRMGPQNQKVFVQRKTLLDSLLRSIRAGTADNVIKCIKDGASLGEIAQALKSADSSSSAEPTPTPIPTPGAESHRSQGRSDEESEASDGKMSSSHAEGYHKRTQILANYGNLPMSAAIRTNGLSPWTQGQQIAHLSKAMWECTPLICDDASSGDAFSLSCLSFRNLAREQLANGASSELILSLNGIEMDLLFRDRLPSDPHTVSTWACELLKTFDVINPVAKLAGAEGVAYLMRWLIAPTRESYLALPEASRPTESQLFVPHSIDIDIFMFPEIRDVLLARGETGTWMNNIKPDTLQFNWPYSVEACLEILPTNEGEHGLCMRLSKAFVEHIRNPDNVSFDRAILTPFPELKGRIKCHDSSPTACILPVDDRTDIDVAVSA